MRVFMRVQGSEAGRAGGAGGHGRVTKLPHFYRLLSIRPNWAFSSEPVPPPGENRDPRLSATFDSPLRFFLRRPLSLPFGTIPCSFAWKSLSIETRPAQLHVFVPCQPVEPGTMPEMSSHGRATFT